MLISRESLLRRVPTTVEPRTVLFLDGIRYSIEIIDVAFERLKEILEKIADRRRGADDLGPRIVEAISEAWLIVDSTHRLRGLVQQLPGLKQNNPDVQLFVRNTANVETLRHFVQHFHSEIESFVVKGMPLWGTLSWSRICPETKTPVSHTIVPGTFYHHVWAAGCVFDFHTGKFVDRIVLHAGNARSDLAAVFDRVAAFLAWFEKWYSSVHSSEDRHGADVHFHVSLSKVAAEGSSS